MVIIGDFKSLEKLSLMRLLRSGANNSENFAQSVAAEGQNSVVTIGNFDGVHRGHQAILQQLVSLARQHNATPTVITFEPHPEEYFLGEKAPPRLTSFSEKYALLKQFGIEQLCCLRFNQDLSSMTAAEFVQKILLEKVGTTQLIIGDDFRFGFQRQGDYQFLKTAGQQFGFEVTPTATVTHLQQRISSTRVRSAILEGDFDLANELMGHGFFLSGRVMHGDKRGRTLGFATANVSLGRRKSVLNGVYAVKGWVVGEKSLGHLKGVANVGIRPTVNGKQNRIEAHWFDFEGDLYSKKIRLQFIQKIRQEKKFDSLQQLTEQIKLDSEIARKILDN